MNILISVNEYAINGAKLTMFSFMKYHKNVNWFITTLNIKIEDEHEGLVHNHVGISQKMLEELTKIVKYFDSNSTVTFIDTTELYKEHLFGGPNDLSPFTPFANNRLMIDLFIPDYIHELMYLDIDTIILSSIEDDYYKYTNINSPYAAYVIPEACEHKGEMISAVMFFNLDKCRETKFFETARRNFKKNFYTYPDQMAIRDTCEPIKIDESLNYMRELHEATIEIKIVHFSSRLAPKIYHTVPELFFKKFQQFKYLQDEMKIFESIHFNLGDE